uniref:Uncharacterized protein n=1 Tax=Arundo donax TaxID=35708 RepID=A0A0A9A9U8_ARUDO
MNVLFLDISSSCCLDTQLHSKTTTHSVSITLKYTDK